MDAAKWLALVAVCTVLAGLTDGYGLYHGSRVLVDGKVDVGAMARSAVGFAIGTFFFWVTTAALQRVGNVSAELQTLTWFGVAIVGVAALSGKVLQWQRSEQVIGAAVLLGIGWLLARTGG